jgi:DNA-binding Xre family transcriptional regulator
MKWNLRMAAAERGIWKSTDVRRMLADAGLEISAGKMSGLWTGTPTTIRLDDLDVICEVLGCEPSKLLISEPGKVAALRAAKTASKTGTGDESQGTTPTSPAVQPRLGRNRTRPPE